MVDIKKLKLSDKYLAANGRWKFVVTLLKLQNLSGMKHVAKKFNSKNFVIKTGNPALEGAGYFFNISSIQKYISTLLWSEKCGKLEKVNIRQTLESWPLYFGAHSDTNFWKQKRKYYDQLSGVPAAKS